MITEKFKEKGAKVVVDEMTDFIIDYAYNAGIKTLVVGVSGGVDSAVVASVCARALHKSFLHRSLEYRRDGLTDLVLVQMPISQHSTEHDRASEFIDWLIQGYPNKTVHNRFRDKPKITKIVTDLNDAFVEMERAINPRYKESFPDHDADWNFTGGNTRARLRMTTLYHIAGLKCGLVVGTGNKVEDFGIGFFTKYGDGGVDISPIGDLNKSEVYAVAEYLGISEAITGAEPTDGLHGTDRESGSTTDAEQLGFENMSGKVAYGYLEDAMRLLDELGEETMIYLKPSLHKDLAKALEIVIKRRKQNAHKMVMPPVFKLT